MHYFVDTLGSGGFTSFGVPFETKKLYGYPQETMREIVENLSVRAKEKNIKAEYIHCFLNNGIKGILFPQIKKGVVNKLSYEETGVINVLDNGYADALRELGKAKGYFVSALKVHDEWEKYYIDNVDYGLIDDECKRLTKILLDGKSGKGEGKANIRFLGAATAFGPIDYIPSITEDIVKRYFIKGRPGTGKSTFMKRIANDALAKGFDVEKYHCSFDPKSVDMIVIRELGVCIFDSTLPHEHFPERENDEILDFYELAAKRNIDREFKSELSSVSARYKEKINLATDCIARCNNIMRQNEKSYVERIDKKNVILCSEVLAAEIFGG